MVTVPKCLPGDASVDDARDLLRDDHVHLVLLVDAGVLKGTLLRSDLPAESSPGAALPHARLRGRTVLSTAAAQAAMVEMVAGGQRRRAVVDDEGRLLGLLCLKASGRGFCRDADVAARAKERRR
jgi:CBS domain-containing protein